MGGFFSGRVFSVKKGLFGVILASVFAVGAYAQEMDIAHVPFLVNVDATVRAVKGDDVISMTVTANTEKNMLIPIPIERTSILKQKPLKAPGKTPIITSNHRGWYSLYLPGQIYRTAEVSLYSLSGKRILRTNASASETHRGISRQNLTTGVYLLSVKSASGASFASRLTHQGGNLNISIAFGGENITTALSKSAVNEEKDTWDITVSAEGYIDSTYQLSPVAGMNPVQEITLNIDDIVIIDAMTPDITLQPASGSVTTGAAHNIFVKANVTDGGTLSYQWYSNTSADNNGGAIINGATDSVYNVPTSATGTLYYYVIITNTNNEASNNKTAVIKSDAAVIAVSPTISYYTLGVNMDPLIGGNVSREPDLTSYAGGTQVTVTAEAAASYVFVNWSGASNSTNPSVTITVNANTTLTANFALRQYTVTYNINGGTGTAPSTQTVNHGSSVTLPGGSGFSRDGYTFSGWGPTGTSRDYNAGASFAPTANTTLYAIWMGELTYFRNTGGQTRSVTFIAGSSIILLPASTYLMSGHEFTGWNTNALGTGTNYAAGGQFTPTTANSTLYARWRPGATKDGSYLITGGRAYPTIMIGGKIWIGDNLHFLYHTGGTSTCSEYNYPTTCDNYGRLYNWEAAVTACPAGWRLPTVQDWDNLVAAAGGSNVAGTTLKSKTGWNTAAVDYIAGTDVYGFGAAPGGRRNADGSFFGLGDIGIWWTATDGVTSDGQPVADSRSMGAGWGQATNVINGTNLKTLQYSVRCMTDSW